MIRILHLSDIHFGCENKPAVAAVRDFILSQPFDLLAVTGDVTTVGALQEFRDAAAWLKALPGPQLGTPGNHDTPYADLTQAEKDSDRDQVERYLPLIEQALTNKLQ